MLNTGVVRKVDVLGRVVLPKELRKVLGLEDGTAMEIYTDKGTVVLKKYERGCTFCGECTDVTDFKGKAICECCIGDIRSSEIIFLD